MARTVKDFVEQFRTAFRVSTPLVGVCTADVLAMIRTVAGVVADSPLLLWDVVRGVSALNTEGQTALARLTDGGTDGLVNPVEALVRAQRLPKRSVLFFMNAHRQLVSEAVVQAIANLRDEFKHDGRMLVLTGPSLTLPAELSHDVVILEEPLPDAERLKTVVLNTFASANLTKPHSALLHKAVDAVIGLTDFEAEQACAISLRKAGLDLSELLERKRQQISQTPGLSVWRGDDSFNSVGGCGNVKAFFNSYIGGAVPPRGVVFIDEIEKHLAGMAGDLSGTTQEMTGALLTWMQDKEANGALFIGPPGTAKSAVAKALGNEASVPTICFDISGMKGSLVGESGANMRNGLRVVDAVCQGRPLVIATCNSISVLPPELRRRFTFGTFFFDLPTGAERAEIWKMYLNKYPVDGRQVLPESDEGWTGAEIRQCCYLAATLGITHRAASMYIVPVSISAAEQIEDLRAKAAGRYISAAQPGFYQPQPKPAGRSFSTHHPGGYVSRAIGKE